MLEQCKEIVHKFNSVYGETLTEPEIILPSNQACLRLPGIDGKAKMSKSLGNVVWLKDIVNMYPPQAYRLFVLNNHYRQTINYSEEMMNKMVNEWNKIEKAYISLYRNLDLKGALNKQEVLPIMDDFLNEMAYDFNTANAVTALYSHIKNINKDLRNASEDVLLLQKDLATFDAMLYVLGLKVDVKPLTEEEKE